MQIICNKKYINYKLLFFDTLRFKFSVFILIFFTFEVINKQTKSIVVHNIPTTNNDNGSCYTFDNYFDLTIFVTDWQVIYILHITSTGITK